MYRDHQSLRRRRFSYHNLRAVFNRLKREELLLTAEIYICALADQILPVLFYEQQNFRKLFLILQNDKKKTLFSCFLVGGYAP